MKLRNLLTWFIALFAVALTQTACSSDEDETASTPLLPTEFVGTWDFDDFTLTFDSEGNGVLEYAEVDESDPSAVPYEVFNYDYSVTTGIIKALCLDNMTITFDDPHLDADGRLVITYGMGGTEKTASGTKHTFISISYNQMLGTWNLKDTNAEFFHFTKSNATVTSPYIVTGTWRTSGSSIWITIDGQAYEYIRNITIEGVEMKAHVYEDGHWYPRSFVHTDNGGNTESDGGGEGTEKVDNGNSTGDSKPGTSDGSYWGE